MKNKSRKHRRSLLAVLIAVLIILCAASAFYIVQTSTQRTIERNIDIADTVPAVDDMCIHIEVHQAKRLRILWQHLTRLSLKALVISKWM